MLINKTCNNCKQVLDIRFFYANKKARDGYKNKCKLCVNYSAKSKSFNIDKYYENNGKYYLKNIKSFIRDNDEGTNDLRIVFNKKPTKLIDVWSKKKGD